MLTIIQAAGWPIWPLIACSILALALIVERFISLKTSKVAPDNLVQEAISVSRQGVPSAQVIEQLAQNSALGAVLANGLQALGQTRDEEQLRAQMEAAGRAAAHKLERYLGALATIASAAPLLGLLGTVIGMMHLFLGILDHGVGDVSQLAGGIGQALVTTASGMCVAIPALVFHRYFRGLIAAYGIDMEREANALIDALESAAPPAAQSPPPGAPPRRRSTAG